jgi:hypothetical protein
MSFMQERTSKETREQIDLEIEAAILIDQMDSMDDLVWCRRWADVMAKLKAPCAGYASWEAWLAAREAELQAGARNDMHVEIDGFWSLPRGISLPLR